MKIFKSLLLVVLFILCRTIAYAEQSLLLGLGTPHIMNTYKTQGAIARYTYTLPVFQDLGIGYSLSLGSANFAGSDITLETKPASWLTIKSGVGFYKTSANFTSHAAFPLGIALGSGRLRFEYLHISNGNLKLPNHGKEWVGLSLKF